MMGNWGAFGWLWMLVPLLFWGGLLAVIVWAVARVFPNRGTGGEPPRGRASSAEDVLRERFARGEIDAAPGAPAGRARRQAPLIRRPE